ncbi:hypothetical protein [Sulfobacillus thermosulfidooxidans]|uniref:DUF2909 domain-containing protein n=1 Tax=Sulfobacillus thermosulfidooxidans TaxID=28034 RepID=A0A2T2WZ33_SULTH|nr:hypothetical protein [Sulfobacillus thermosulfidooxidans]PSR27491.1 MAG: hypothetical protein C7B47_07980 [Sulfobacillus thermosulfidooxidans]
MVFVRNLIGVALLIFALLAMAAWSGFRNGSRIRNHDGPLWPWVIRLLLTGIVLSSMGWSALHR